MSMILAKQKKNTTLCRRESENTKFLYVDFHVAKI